MSVKAAMSPGSLERAIVIAAEVHAGVTDKAGAPYLLHPLRVMHAVDGPVARIVAVLHDVVEDGAPEWTPERLREEGFSDEVLEALAAVTKNPDEEDAPGASAELKLENYLRFVRRAARHPVGRLVKLADLNDNLDIRRLEALSEKDRLRTNKYLRARAELLASPVNGGSS